MINNNAYKYATFVLATILVVIIAAVLSYNLGYGSGKGPNSSTIPFTSIQPTTIPATKANPTYCSTQPLQLYVGNSLACGPFIMKIMNISNATIGLNVSYNGIYLIKTVNKTDREKGTFPVNFSNTTVFVRVWDFSVPMQTVYIQMSTDPVVLTTTITLPPYNTTSTRPT
jgi:hypothetical protein